jgi:hypothetical protein
MEKFMLIIREDLEKMDKMSNEERFSMIPMMLEWVDSLIKSGNYLMGEPLLISGRYVSKDQILRMDHLSNPVKAFQAMKLSGLPALKPYEKKAPEIDGNVKN